MVFGDFGKNDNPVRFTSFSKKINGFIPDTFSSQNHGENIFFSLFWMKIYAWLSTVSKWNTPEFLVYLEKLSLRTYRKL